MNRPWLVQIALCVAACRPDAVDLDGDGGGTGDGGDIGDGSGSDTGGGPIICEPNVVGPVWLGDVYEHAASRDGCLLGYQYAFGEGGDELRVLSLHSAQHQLITEQQVRSVSAPWTFVGNHQAIVYREPFRLLHWTPDAGSRLIAEPAGEFKVTADGAWVVYAEETGYDAGPVYATRIDRAPEPNLLAERARFTRIGQLGDGTYGVTLQVETDGGPSLQWASLDGTELHTIVDDASVIGEHALTDRIVYDQWTGGIHLYGLDSLRGDGATVPLDIEPPPHPGDAFASGLFSPSGARLVLKWEFFDFDYGGPLDTLHVIDLDGDVDITTYDCADSNAVVLDEGVLCRHLPEPNVLILRTFDGVEHVIDDEVLGGLWQISPRRFVYNRHPPDRPLDEGPPPQLVVLEPDGAGFVKTTWISDGFFLGLSRNGPIGEPRFFFGSRTLSQGTPPNPGAVESFMHDLVLGVDTPINSDERTPRLVLGEGHAITQEGANELWLVPISTASP